MCAYIVHTHGLTKHRNIVAGRCGGVPPPKANIVSILLYKITFKLLHIHLSCGYKYQDNLFVYLCHLRSE